MSTFHGVEITLYIRDHNPNGTVSDTAYRLWDEVYEALLANNLPLAYKMDIELTDATEHTA